MSPTAGQMKLEEVHTWPPTSTWRRSVLATLAVAKLGLPGRRAQETLSQGGGQAKAEEYSFPVYPTRRPESGIFPVHSRLSPGACPPPSLQKCPLSHLSRSLHQVLHLGARTQRVWVHILGEGGVREPFLKVGSMLVGSGVKGLPKLVRTQATSQEASGRKQPLFLG